MTTGYIVSGRGDLDTIFKPRASTAGAVTHFLSNGGVDLALRYEPRGSTTPVADTNFKVGAVDLAQKFMAIGGIGTATYTLVSGNLGGITGYSDGLAFPDLTGDSISATALGAYTIASLVWSSPNSTFVLKDASVNPPNADSSWIDLSIIGIFQNSGGVSVTRSFTRAAASYSTDGTSPNLRGRWVLSGTAASFINGNSYAVTIHRS